MVYTSTLIRGPIIKLSTSYHACATVYPCGEDLLLYHVEVEEQNMIFKSQSNS